MQPVAVLHAAAGHFEFDTHDVFDGHVTSHRHDAWQSVPLLQAPLSHDTEQGPVPHATKEAQLFGPQLTAHDDAIVQSTPLLQAFAPQLTEQGVEPQTTGFEQAPMPHVTEQLDACPQLIGLRQVPSSQCTVHWPVPHVMGVGQAPDPVHVMSQLVARVQSTLLLQAFVPQVTRQGSPAGHTTVLAQLPDVAQSITQTAPSHLPVAQPARHAAVA